MKLSDFSEQRLEIFSLYGKSEQDVKEYIELLRLWMSKMPHLPGDKLEDNFLEILMVKNKFSLEKCKTKIEWYCTLKGRPNYEVVYERIPIPSKEPVFYLPLPMLTEERKRIIVYKIDDTEGFDMIKDLAFNSIYREFMLRHDYSDGDIYISDFQNCTPRILTKFRVNIFVDALELILKGYSTRLSEIHFISKIGKSLLSPMLPFIPKKYVSRIQVHDDGESLRKKIPAKYVPSDYGGDYKSVAELRAEWNRIFEENHQLLYGYIATKAREELRQRNGSTSEELKGTFKKLNLD